MLFVEVHYTLATEEAERIGVDHVARLSASGTIDGATGINKCTVTLAFALARVLPLSARTTYFLKQNKN
jgi:hypothetical protein